MEELRIIVAAAIAALATLLFVIARVTGLGSRLGSLLLVVGALEMALWVPAGVRDWTLAVLLALAVLGSWDSGNSTWAVVCALAAGALAILLGRIPGGNTALILSTVGVFGFFRVRSSVRHVRRLRRAAALRPGELPGGDVMVGGTVHDGTAAPPLGREVTAAWWAVVLDDQHRATSGVLRVNTDAGTVLADLGQGGLELSVERCAFNQSESKDTLDALLRSGEDRSAVPADANSSVAPATGNERASYSFYWLEPGDHVVLVGTPTWERAPADMAGYRDAPLVPMFHAKDVFVANTSVTGARQDAVWSVITWAAWGPVCLAVGVLQLWSLI